MNVRRAKKRLRRSDSLADLQPGGRIASPNFSKQRFVNARCFHAIDFGSNFPFEYT